jgi:hypothetical protein
MGDGHKHAAQPASKLAEGNWLICWACKKASLSSIFLKSNFFSLLKEALESFENRKKIEAVFKV